ncbi:MULTISPECIES: alpha/beta hydrolase family protein [unclassified Leucobacter]|uniref:alpha/beta hydrolase family protein n=1 Tax=unclassified Leucobacter TaxID=2621730 RepID=UPI00301B00B9
MEDWQRNTARALGFAAGAAAVGTVGIIAGGVALARIAVTPEQEAESPVTVLGVHREGAATLVRLRGVDCDLQGRYSLVFDHGAGHARLGPVLASGREGTIRELLRVDRGEPRAGMTGRLTGWWYTSPEELGYATERITYPTELGDAEAWIVHPARARKKRWAVHVHGRGAPPEEALRGIAPLARAGVTSLVISYRNDPGAPSGVNGRYGVGVSEARDVDAAIAEARRRGAQRVTLFGWSMGGTAALVTATRGANRDVIDGLILDSPAVDWSELLRYHAAGRRAPRLVAELGIRLLWQGRVRGGEHGGIAFDSLNAAAFGRELQVPVLIHASEQDTFVPCSGSQRLAEERPDLVQLRLQQHGEHVKLWNVDPEPWERVTEQFARALPRPAWRG